MATPTPAPASKPKPELPAPQADELKSSYAFDPAVQHTEGGFGTQQRELKPEDYPASLRMAPPAEQLNPNAKATVGTPIPGLIAGEADRAVAEGIEQHNELVRKAQAKIDDTNAERTEA